MDPTEDPPPPNESPPNSSQTDTPTSGTSTTRRLRDKVNFFEKVWTGTKRTLDNDEPDGLHIDVTALEKRLKEEHERKKLTDSPFDSIKLRSTPQPSPKRIVPTTFPVNLRHRFESADSETESFEETVQKTSEEGELHGQSRFTKTVRVTVRKSVKEVTVKSPVVKHYVYNETFSRTPSQEINLQEDSAYQTHSYNLAGEGGNISHSSSITTGKFPSDEFIVLRRTPSRERIQYDLDSSSNFSSIGSTSMHHCHGKQYHVDSSIKNTGNVESSNAEALSDYQSFQTMAAKMEFVRSKSQYDSHIIEIRGK